MSTTRIALVLLGVAGGLGVGVASGLAARDGQGPRVSLRTGDKVLAAKANLRVSDLPDGWTAITSEPIGKDFLLACEWLNPDLSKATITGLDAKTFVEKEEAQQASSLIVVFRTRHDAMTAYATDYSLYFDKCVTPSVGHTRGGLRVLGAQRLRLVTTAGARVTAGRTIVDLGGNQGARVKGVVDQVVVLRGRTIVVLDFQGTDTALTDPVGLSLENSLVRLLVTRLPAG